MKTIAEIHLENLNELSAPFESNRQFAIHLNKDPKQVNAWWGKGTARGIGPKIARELEDAFGKPLGWIDNDHSQLRRLDASIVSLAIKEARKMIGLTGDDDFDAETEPEILAQAIRVTLAKALEIESGGVHESARRDGQAFGADRAKGPKEAGEEVEPASRRQRKSA